MKNITLYPITELNMGYSKHKLAMDVDDGVYTLRPCSVNRDTYGLKVVFESNYEVVTETDDISYKFLINGAEKYAKSKDIRNFIPLVLRKNVYTMLSAIINLDSMKIIHILSEQECGNILKVNTVFRSVSYEQNKSCERYSTLQV